MSDLYREQLIKTKSSAGQKILCVFLTLGTILLLALGIFFMPVILVAGLALGPGRHGWLFRGFGWSMNISM